MDQNDCELMKPQRFPDRGKFLRSLSNSGCTFPGLSPPEDSPYHLMLKNRH